MKKWLLLATGVAMLNLCSAQTYDTTTFYGKMNFVFKNVNKASITTGLLWDYGIDFGTLTSYPGTVLNHTNWGYPARFSCIICQPVQPAKAM